MYYFLDIDECAADPNLCENECKNIKGSYYCTDGDGYGVVQGTGEKISEYHVLQKKPQKNVSK